MMKPKTMPRSRLLALLFAFALVVAACGSDGDDDAATDDASSDTTAAEETEEAAETETTAAAEEEAEEPAETETTAAAEEETEEAAPADGIAIELGEWFISEPGALSGGTITFAVSNSGENPHALAIARGTSYEELPQLENGAVDTDMLGDDYLGTTDNLDTGGTASIDFDLEAGDYVFFCPIQFGPNSHAAQGQVLSVTVG